jgi:flavin-dependent thymidylate synthase
MEVVLAGYNIDSRVLGEAADAGIPRDRLTPEVLSAAYARISRDPRPVGELRRAALEEVEQARRSNRSIIFGMGHHSVAEHAVFNFDVTGISRLAIEALERFRLCSFTEKSQRYITLDHDFVVPAELAGTPAGDRLRALAAAQAEAYERLHVALRRRLDERHPEHLGTRSGKRLLDGWAKEDARYVTLLSTSGQLGMTVNARNAEHVVRRLAAEPLEELRRLGRAIHDEAKAIAPSLLLFTEPSDFDTGTGAELGALAAGFLSDPGGEGPLAAGPDAPPARLVADPGDPDRQIAAALLFRFSGAGYERCRQAAFAADREALAGLFEAAFRRMEFFDAPLREFEHAALTFEAVVSAACFAQLKRHRMATQTWGPYDPGLGVTVPPAVAEVGLADLFASCVERSEALHRELRSGQPAAAAYALTNAHRRRVLLTVDLRDLYHFVRLREDAHAQWDIRRLASAMRTLAEERAPLSSLLLCGKDRFVERYERLFGRPPKVDPAALES